MQPRFPKLLVFGLATFGCALAARAEAQPREELRTDEAQTPEPLTKQPLKAVMQNLFLQEDPFPQQHFHIQTGLRVTGDALNEDGSLSIGAAVELGLWDSWTLQVRAPVTLVPSDDRGFGNPELSVLYSMWVSGHEDFRLTANLRNVLPTPSAAGENAFAHDLSLIGYARWAPLHVQATATLDVSYGDAMPDGPQLRPEVSTAAIIKLKDFAFVLEAALQREFQERRYLGALGFFWYPGSFEIGVAATLDVTQRPLTVGAIGLISYGFVPPE